MRHREPASLPEAHSAQAPAEERDDRQGGADGFDWWAAPGSRPGVAGSAAGHGTVAAEFEPERESEPEPEPEFGQSGPEQAIPVQAAAEPPVPQPPPFGAEPAGTEPVRGVAEGVAEAAWPAEPAAWARQLGAAAVYRHVQAGEEFQEVRREYRRFVLPACAVFLAWYLAYIVAAVTLPGLMDHQFAGPFTVAWALGLLQFASTFLITWLYARHARDRRDRLALGLRWETQDRLR
ncbi:DUF485 domain-containing protein [Streptacidiphilus carbonis]|uniref:DUF485 domain-containing protein n=1 Tax=Streptacidiphilus carbonis TaxID=105422 RepID=UPI0006938CD3